MRIFLLLVLSLTLIAASEDSVIEALPQPAKMAQRMRMPFQVERHIALFTEPLVSQGELLVDRDRQAVRWHFAGEVTLILLADNFRRFGPDGQEERVNLQRDPGAQVLKQQMAAFRDGDWSALTELFTLNTTEQGDLTLLPRNPEMERIINRIVVRMDPDSGAPRSLRLYGADENKTLYHFSEPEINPEFDAALFTQP